jgi:hypothetical protein
LFVIPGAFPSTAPDRLTACGADSEGPGIGFSPFLGDGLYGMAVFPEIGDTATSF